MTWIEERDGSRTLRLRLYDPDDVGLVLSAAQAEFLGILLTYAVVTDEAERKHRHIILRALVAAKAGEDRWDSSCQSQHAASAETAHSENDAPR